MERYIALYLAMLIPALIMLLYGLRTKIKIIWIIALALLLCALLIIWAMNIQINTVIRT